ncbi:MAG: quinone-dependent dihydroorotate dehydrogenase [Rikenellaceae bacterium]
MYKKLIRPLLFLLPPETIHILLVKMIKATKFIPFLSAILRNMFCIRHKCLEREIFGLRIINPVGLPAGFDKGADIYNELSNFGFGSIEVGTVTPRPQSGNPRPRVFRIERDNAIINRMGFNCKGVRYVSNNLRRRRKNDIIIAGNIGKNSVTPNEHAAEDYLASFRALYDKVDYFVVNVSCPNVSDLTKLQSHENLSVILDGLVTFRRGQDEYRPILLKISPDLTFQEIDSSIEIVKEYNLDGIVATNTTVSREGLSVSQSKVQSIGRGGLSGAPLTERSLEIVRYIHKKTGGEFPIIGVGGIMTVEDALNMLDAGATIIQIYTGFIYNGPSFAKDICKALIEREKQKRP